MSQIQNHTLEQMQIAEKLFHLNKKKRVKKLKKWFLDIDSFGHQVNLGFEDHLVHKTYLGSFLTIVLFILVAVLIYVSLRDLINKNNPSILRSEMLVNQQDNSLELPHDFVFAIVFQDTKSGQNINPDGIFKLTALNQQFQNNSLSTFEIQIGPCTLSHFTKNSLPLFQSELNKGNVLCIKDSDLFQKLKMYGTLDDDVFNNILFKVESCDENNQNSLSKCLYSQQQTLDIVNQTKIKIYFTDFLFNPNDFEQPYQIFKRTICQKLQNDQFSLYNLIFTESYIFTDSNYVTTNYKQQKYPTFISANSQFEPRTDLSTKPLFLFQSSVEPRGILYERSYQKLQIFIGTIGGFMKAIFCFFFFFSAPFVKLSLNTEIVNRIFNFSSKDDDESDLDEEDKKQHHPHNLNHDTHQVTEMKELQTVKHNDVNSIKNQDQKINNPQQIQNIQTIIKAQTQLNESQIHKQKLKSSILDNSKTQMITKQRVDRVSMTQYNAPQQKCTLYQIDQSKSLKGQENNQSETQFPVRKHRRSTTKLIHNIFKSAIIHKDQKDEDSLINLEVIENQKAKLDIKKENEEQLAIKSEQKTSKQNLKKTEEDLQKNQEEDFDSVFKKLFKSNEQTLKMKCADYICYFLHKITCGCFKFDKNKQIQNSMRRVGERMDIIFILKKLIEVDKLKMLLLNDDQRKLFDYLPRPVVHLNKRAQIQRRKSSTATDINQSLFDKHQGNLYEQWNNMFLQQEAGYFQKCVQALYAFQNIKQKGSKDQLDYRLLDFMDPHKKRFFNTDHPIHEDSFSVAILENHNNQQNNLTQQNMIQQARRRSVSDCKRPSLIFVPEKTSIHTNCDDSRIPNENALELNFSTDIHRKFQFHTFVSPIGSTTNQ
ncbi:hypothetical protein ABPG72_015189 [Tetrahymena utriculariae]